MRASKSLLAILVARFTLPILTVPAPDTSVALSPPQPANITAAMAVAVAALPASVSEVWVTEWSLNMNAGKVNQEADVFGSWASGLFSAATALGYAGISRISMIGKHELLGDASAGAIFADADGFDVPRSVDAKLTSLPNTLTASGWSLALIANASAGARSAAPLALGSPLLVGVAFDQRAVVLNLAPDAGQLPAGALPSSVTASLSASADALLAISNQVPYALNILAGPVDPAHAVTLPPYSISTFI